MSTFGIVFILVMAGIVLLGGACAMAVMLHKLNEDNDIDRDYDEED